MEKFKGMEIVQSLKETIESKQSVYRPTIWNGIIKDIENLIKLISPHDNIEGDVPSLNDESQSSSDDV